MTDDTPLFLVTGATGTQGGAVARAMLAAGHRVRAFTRSPDGTPARVLAELGAEIAGGDFDDVEKLAAAVNGAAGVFSVQRPDADGSDSERRHGFALINAARAAGIRHFVHSSVCQADEHESFARWDEGYWARGYWTDKADVEKAVREADFPAWTILRPSFIMENFTGAKAQFLYPQLRQGELLSPILPEARLQLIAGEEIGAWGRAAFEHPELFAGQTVDMVGDTLTMDEIAATLGQATGRPVRARSAAPADVLATGIPDKWVRSQEWINDVGYRADTSQLAKFGVSPVRLADWSVRHASEIVVEGARP